MFVPRPYCNLCHSQATQTVLSRPFTDPSVWGFLKSYYADALQEGWFERALYEVRKCAGCGFLWQSYILNDQGMQALYGDWISAEDSFKKKTSAAARPESLYGREMAIIGAVFPRQKPYDLQLLDFGMGWGFWCMAAKEAGYRVKGLEIAEDRVSFARSRGVTVIDSLGREKFDFVNAEQVFEHLPEPLDTLKSIVEVMHPGAVLRISVPDGTGAELALAQSGWRAGKDALHPLEHINCFNRRTLTELGKQAGLVTFHPPVPMTGGPARIAREMVTHVRRRFKGATFYYRKPG